MIAFLSTYFNKAIALLGVLGGVILAIFAIYSKGKSAGKDSATVVYQKQETERTEAVLNEIKKQQEAIQAGASLHRDDIDNELFKGKF